MGRNDRYNHPRRNTYRIGNYLHLDRRPQLYGYVTEFLPRPEEDRQHSLGQQYLPLLCRYGDDGCARYGCKQPLAQLP